MTQFAYIKGYLLILSALLLSSACVTSSAHQSLADKSAISGPNLLVWSNTEKSYEHDLQMMEQEENLQILEDLALSDAANELKLLNKSIEEEISSITESVEAFLAMNAENTDLEKDDLDYLYLIRPDANIRSDDLKTVLRKPRLNDQVYLTGRKQSPEGTNFAFEEVTFSDGSTGWVASHLLEPLESPVGEERVIRVNLTTNRLSFFVDGKVKAEWNVGSGKDLDENITPVGSYQVLHKDRCSVWMPKGEKFSDQGPCRSANPLGDFQVWFHKGRTYGLHGTNKEELLATGTTSEDRRVSAGCVRNPNDNMAWLYKRIKVGDKVEIGYFGYSDQSIADSSSKMESRMKYTN